MTLKKKLFFISIVLTGLGLIVIFYIVKTSIYQYEVSENYDYEFNQSNLIKVKIEDRKLTLPDTLNSEYSAFLKVLIKSNIFGKIFEPSIKVSNGNKNLVQYVELGAQGYRYINLSSLILGGSKEIFLEGNKVIIKDQLTELLVFKKPSLSRSKILIIAPHPDDAEIAAYGLYSKYPANSFILTITAGEAGEFKYDELYSDFLLHSYKKGQLRTWNSITIPLLSGVSHTNTLNLGFFDTTLKMMFEKNPININSVYVKTFNINTFRKYNISKFKNNLSGTSNWNSLVNNIKFLLSEINPDIIITPYPALDSHSDHKYSSIALFQAIQESRIKEGLLFLYTNHLVLSEYYPYGNTGSIVSLPPNLKNDIYFNSIYSNCLDKTMQTDKVFALEAMNDLRLDTEWRFWFGASKRAIKTIAKKILNLEKDYFRRAIRSEELFFVVPVRDIYDDTILNKITNGNYNAKSKN